MVKVEAIYALHPTAQPEVDFSLRDDSDGSGAYIEFWNVGILGPQPDQAELDAGQAIWNAGTTKYQWDKIRGDRNLLLRGNDWTHTTDSPLSVGKKTEWAIYRQELRDIPQSFTSVNDIVWPIEPI